MNRPGTLFPLFLLLASGASGCIEHRPPIQDWTSSATLAWINACAGSTASFTTTLDNTTVIEEAVVRHQQPAGLRTEQVLVAGSEVDVFAEEMGSHSTNRTRVSLVGQTPVISVYFTCDDELNASSVFILATQRIYLGRPT